MEQLKNTFIPIQLLKKWSDENYNTLNRNVDVESVIEKIPNIIGVIPSMVMMHTEAFGEYVGAHHRLFTSYGMTEDGKLVELTLSQDITTDQYDLLMDIQEEIHKAILDDNYAE